MFSYIYGILKWYVVEQIIHINQINNCYGRNQCIIFVQLRFILLKYHIKC
jgi:hypothetical protein